jgi:hypothetical protein
MQEVLDIQAQHHDDVEVSVESDGGDSFDEENTQELVAYVGNNISEIHPQPRRKPTYATKEKKTPRQKMRRSTATAQLSLSTSGVRVVAAAKSTNRKMKSEEGNVVDQTKSKDSEKIKVHPSSKSRFSEVKKMEQNDLDDPKIQYFKDAHRSGNKGKVRPSL